MVASFRLVGTDCLLVGPALYCLQPRYIPWAAYPLLFPQNISVSVVPSEQDLYIPPQHRQKNRHLPIAAGMVLWCELVFVTNPVVQLDFPSSSGWKEWTCRIMDFHLMASTTFNQHNAEKLAQE